MDLLERALADLFEHPDSTAREIAKRLDANDREVFRVLDNAAYRGKCQRWKNPGEAWRWELPGPPPLVRTASLPNRPTGRRMGEFVVDGPSLPELDAYGDYPNQKDA